MSMQIEIPDPIAKGLEERAAIVGTTPEELALAAIKREIASAQDLDTIFATTRRAFAESGMSEDDSFDFLEVEKHASRSERRTGK